MNDYIDLDLTSPWLNAAGSLGFAPAAEAWSWPERQGGFVTNPVSLSPRAPAETRAVLPYPGGNLLHSGLPNPGLSAVLRNYGERWARASLPLWVHLLADAVDDIRRMVRALEEIEGVSALEIAVPPAAAPDLALALLQAAVGELAVIACLPLNRAGEGWLGQLARLGVRGLCLTAPRGVLPAANGRLTAGRLVGPGLFPQALAALELMRPLGLPLVMGSAVFSAAAGRALLEAGAAAVQVDSALWME